MVRSDRKLNAALPLNGRLADSDQAAFRVALDRQAVGAWSRSDQAGASADASDTPIRHLVLGIPARSIYGVQRSWFCGLNKSAEVRGNPVRVRDCPAAVNGNDSRPSRARRRAAGTALGLISLGSDGR